MSLTVYESIYSKLKRIGILNDSGLMPNAYMKFTCHGLMDLNVDRLTDDTISLAHNGIQNGDLMADPDMEVRINPPKKTAEALTFQNDYVGIYQRVYDDNGAYKPAFKNELNVFLDDWLSNILDAKYQLKETED